MDAIGLPPFDKKYIDAFVTYVTFFLSRYVGNDVQVLCGSLFDTPIAKTLILFAIMYSATKEARVAAVMTVFFLLAQYLLSRNKQCGPYVDKTAKSNMDTNIWAPNLSTNEAPSSSCTTCM